MKDSTSKQIAPSNNIPLPFSVYSLTTCLAQISDPHDAHDHCQTLGNWLHLAQVFRPQRIVQHKASGQLLYFVHQH